MTDPSESLLHVVGVFTALLPGGVWVAWWLWAVNWKKLWPILADGGWTPAVLLFLMAAVVWSRVDPGPRSLGFVALPNFVWQLGCVSALAAVALFCGWLQGRLHWEPAEIAVEPPADGDGHGHGQAH